MAKVFISYHSSDKDRASQIAEELRNKGHTVGYADDVDGIIPGSDWRSTIETQLSASDVTIVLLSESSINSQWVIAESSAAMAYVRERDRGAVIPVVFDQIELPPTLQQVQSILADDKSNSEIADIIDKSINELLGRQLARDEKKREAREKVEATAADFIAASQKTLHSRESKYQRMAYFWYFLAYFSLISGVAAGIWRAALVNEQTGNWVNVAQTAIIGLVVIGLIIAVAKFSFTLGKSFMVEALRNADRSHAISFGEFYLNAYGEEAQWKEVKEAFQHWNIDKGSYFLEQSSQEFDPQIFEMAVKIAQLLSTKSKSKEGKQK